MVGSVKTDRTPVHPYTPPWCVDVFYISPKLGEYDGRDVLEEGQGNPYFVLEWLKKNASTYNHNTTSDMTYAARHMAVDGTLFDIVAHRADAEDFDVEPGIHHVVMRIRTSLGKKVPAGLLDALEEERYERIEGPSAWTRLICEMF